MKRNLYCGLLTICSILIVMGTISGCAQIPKKVEFDSSAKTRIKRIALLQIVPSQQISIRNKSNTGVILGFGFIPTLIEEGVIAEKSKKYVEMMKSKKITFVPELVAALQRELRQNGYDVDYLQNQRPKLIDKTTVDYSNIQTESDGILNVYYGPIGYLSPEFKESYAPWVVLGVRLIDARTKDTLYFKNFNVSQVADRITNENIDAIFPDEKYLYQSFDEIIDKFDETIEGVLSSQEKIAVRIAQQLNRN